MRNLSAHGTLAILAAILAFPSLAVAQAGKAPDLSDAEVAHVAVTANTIDIELARVALTRARDAGARQFATTMARDHAAVNERAAALAKKLGVTPKNNAVSQSLLQGADEARAALEPLHAGAFDRAYIEREVAYHQAVLDALDNLLIPTTENPELRTLLTEVRPAIAAHLEYAKSLRTSLATSR